MGFAKPIEQIFIKLSRYIYVSKRYYTRENGYEAIMRSHAVLRGFRHDLGLDIADNLFSCDYGGSAYDRGI